MLHNAHAAQMASLTVPMIWNHSIWELKKTWRSSGQSPSPSRWENLILRCWGTEPKPIVKSFTESSFGPEDKIHPRLQDNSSFIQKAAILKLFNLRIPLCFKITEDSKEILLGWIISINIYCNRNKNWDILKIFINSFKTNNNKPIAS